MHTLRCRRCGLVIDRFVTAVPGLVWPLSHDAISRQMDLARERHEDYCPGPAPEPEPEAATKPMVAPVRVRGIKPRPT